MFFPYSADVHLARFPWVTATICVICAWIFWAQLRSNSVVEQKAERFCSQAMAGDDGQVLRRLDPQHGADICVPLLLKLRTVSDPKHTLDKLLKSGDGPTADRRASVRDVRVRDHLLAMLASFNREVPPSLTERLAYKPGDHRFWTMITSGFAHGDLAHIFFNLLFFYMFAATLENIIGSVVFVGVVLALSVVTSLSYSLYAPEGMHAPPTIGLSGIVFGIMTFTAVLAPSLKIKCFFWLLIIVRVFRLNAIFVASWYVAWNIYDMSHLHEAHINYIAHVSGALFGVVCGLFYRMFNLLPSRHRVGY